MDKIKIVVGGGEFVGKMTIIRQYVENIFYYDSYITNCIERSIKRILINKEEIILEIYNLIKQERFWTINIHYISRAQIALILYSITDRETFNDLQKWVDFVKENNDKIIIGIVGNKIDLFEEREVSEEEGEKFAEDNKCLFFETTAKEHENIENVFQKLIEAYIKKIEDLFLSDVIISKNEERRKMIYKNGDKYNGYWKNNKKEGKGIMKYNNGDKYEGYWKNDKKDGYGIMKYKNGNKYEGNWNNDMKNGDGILKKN